MALDDRTLMNLAGVRSAGTATTASSKARPRKHVAKLAAFAFQVPAVDLRTPAKPLSPARATAAAATSAAYMAANLAFFTAETTPKTATSAAATRTTSTRSVVRIPSIVRLMRRLVMRRRVGTIRGDRRGECRRALRRRSKLELAQRARPIERVGRRCQTEDHQQAGPSKVIHLKSPYLVGRCERYTANGARRNSPQPGVARANSPRRYRVSDETLLSIGRRANATVVFCEDYPCRTTPKNDPASLPIHLRYKELLLKLTSPETMLFFLIVTLCPHSAR